MSREQIAGWLIALAGLVVLVVSAFADQLGIGEDAFTPQQVLAAIAGVAIIILGTAFIFRNPPED